VGEQVATVVPVHDIETKIMLNSRWSASLHNSWKS